MRNGKPKKTKAGVRNAGSGAFNQGSKQDNASEKVMTITDHEKLTGHRWFNTAKKSK